MGSCPLRRALVLGLLVLLGGCGGGERGRPFTPAAARAIFARCAADAKPFVNEENQVSELRFGLRDALSRHQAHAYAGLGRVQSAAAGALAALRPAQPAQARRLGAYLRRLRAIAAAQRRAAPLVARGDHISAATLVRRAQRPVLLLTYLVPDELDRLGGGDCLVPRFVAGG